MPVLACLGKERARHRGHRNAIARFADVRELARDGRHPGGAFDTAASAATARCSARWPSTSPGPQRPTERELRIADICARKAAVFIERARAEDLARQRDRRFQSVLESSGVPFVDVVAGAGRGRQDRRVPLSFVNTAAAAIMRCKPADFIGRIVTETLPRAWDDRGRFEMYVEALERNEVREMERQSEADGNHAWYHIVASPLDGDLAVWFADITQRKQPGTRTGRGRPAQGRIPRDARARAAQSARADSPGGDDRAQRDTPPRRRRRWSNNVIERQVQHMSLLLDDLLDVSRITHGTLAVAQAADRPAVDRGRGGRDRAAADRRAPPPAQRRRARAACR